VHLCRDGRTGLRRDDKVVITADEAVREVITTVFRRFDELGSARQVLIRLREDHLLLPRRRTGSTRIAWADASYPAVHDLLTNPAYAGAFVFGRTRTEKRVDPDTGQVLSRDRVVPREQWEVLIPDPGFITWDKYEANTARLRSNCRGPRDQSGGAVVTHPVILNSPEVHPYPCNLHPAKKSPQPQQAPQDQLA
jgi:hypothetical protein